MRIIRWKIVGRAAVVALLVLAPRQASAAPILTIEAGAGVDLNAIQVDDIFTLSR